MHWDQKSDPSIPSRFLPTLKLMNPHRAPCRLLESFPQTRAIGCTFKWEDLNSAHVLRSVSRCPLPARAVLQREFSSRHHSHPRPRTVHLLKDLFLPHLPCASNSWPLFLPGTLSGRGKCPLSGHPLPASCSKNGELQRAASHGSCWKELRGGRREASTQNLLLESKLYLL